MGSTKYEWTKSIDTRLKVFTQAGGHAGGAMQAMLTTATAAADTIKVLKCEMT